MDFHLLISPTFWILHCCLSISGMPNHIDEDTLLRELYPHLSETERMEVKEFLDAYCAIILRICEREERISTPFDEPVMDQ